MIPRNQIDSVLARSDLVTLMGQQVDLKPNGANRMKGCCPFHNEKTPSFVVYTDNQQYHCFGCSAHGNAISWVMHQDGANYIDAVRRLARDCGVIITETSDLPNNQDKNPDIELLAEVAKWFQENLFHHKQAPTAQDYLKQRGVSAEMLQAFQLGYAPPGWDNLVGQLAGVQEKTAIALQLGLIKHKANKEPEQTDGSKQTNNTSYDAFRDRLIFPITDRTGSIVGFGGRGLHQNQVPKYLNSSESEQFAKSQLLYGEYQAKQAGKIARLLVVEGYMDVIAMHQHGFTNTVACLGTAVSEQQITSMLRTTQNICFVFDGDAAGRKASIRAMQLCRPMLRPGVDCAFVLLPNGEDPDSLLRAGGADPMQSLLDTQMQHWSDFFLKWLYTQDDKHSIEGKTALINIAENELSSLPNRDFRTLLLRQIKDTLGLGYIPFARGKRGKMPPIQRINLPKQKRQETTLIKLLAASIHCSEVWVNVRNRLLPQLHNFCPPLSPQLVDCLTLIDDKDNLAIHLTSKLDYAQQQQLNQHLVALEQTAKITENSMGNLVRGVLRECWQVSSKEQKQQHVTFVGSQQNT